MPFKLIVLLSLLLAVCPSVEAQRKRLILIDSGGSGYMSNHEGYERTRPLPHRR